jgi:hypothetical protein
VHAACYILRNDATAQRKGNEKALGVASADKETRRNECAGENEDNYSQNKKHIEHTQTIKKL